MRLGELLVQEKVVKQEAVDEALEAAVVHGGRLGTNLVELGLLDEKELARCLGKLHSMAVASGEMTPDPKALEQLDANFCDLKDVCPMRVDATRISIAVINPHDVGTLDQIGFKTGKRVTAVLIPEFRMNQLLRRHYKAFRNLRAIDMNTIRKSRAVQAQERADAGMGEDLINEEEFQAIYAQALSGGAPAAEEEIEAVEVVPEAPAPQPPRPIMTPQPQQLRPAAPLPAQPQARAPAAPTPPTAPPIPELPPEPPARVEPPPTPIGFAEAQSLLQKSHDREDIARTVLRFAISKWQRALLLSVQGPLVTGWHGAGKGIREKAIGRIAVALRGQSTLKLVCDTRSHYVGPVKRDAGMTGFYKLLGAGFPTTAVILPLLVRGKVVHLLYVDNGPNQLTTPDIGELLILGQNVTRSYEALLKKRRAGG